MKFTVFTPTYNRAKVLHRVYDSLKEQTFRDFEWIIVDDGSADSTAEQVEVWKKEADFPVSYYYQAHAGKHIAVNLGVSRAKGELFVIADSDDRFRPEALEILLRYWEEIPLEKRLQFRGVTCRCCDAQTQEAVGRTFANGVHDVLGIDAAMIHRYDFEMWGFNRTDVMREYPFPEIPGEELAYYPECIIWHRMGLKYWVRFVDDPLLQVYHDQSNANTGKKRNRSKENIHLWIHYINEIPQYFLRAPGLYLKACAGLVMDGLLLQKTPGQILEIPRGHARKMLTILLFPAGYILYTTRRKNRQEGNRGRHYGGGTGI